MGRRLGSLRLASVPWSQDQEFIYGTHEGLPLLKRNTAPRDVLATYRQLRARGLRPGGKDPVAVLITKHPASGKTNFSSLWQISECVPMRPMTPAKRASIAKATAARRVCRDCGEQGWKDLPVAFGRRCEACRSALGLYDEAMHEVLVGEPTLSAAEHAELDQALVDERAAAAAVIPLQRRAGVPTSASFRGAVIAA
ncbi:RRQRL motif-containing zinc-binding protein [Amycolatopsis eburnea]|uniref:RRQRL motif-containing zinc-binding protein n=1 Tax=Amycolatopsis eburnea TaxID=2267691 RepID=UPI00178240BD|nr:RRQRL motif-containing zinc-binding protein [Amycolatopsis eburnea]